MAEPASWSNNRTRSANGAPVARRRALSSAPSVEASLPSSFQREVSKAGGLRSLAGVPSAPSRGGDHTSDVMSSLAPGVLLCRSDRSSSSYETAPLLSVSRSLKSLWATEPKPISVAARANSTESRYPVLSRSHLLNASFSAVAPARADALESEKKKKSLTEQNSAPPLAIRNHSRISSTVLARRMLSDCSARNSSKSNFTLPSASPSENLAASRRTSFVSANAALTILDFVARTNSFGTRRHGRVCRSGQPDRRPNAKRKIITAKRRLCMHR